MLNPGPPDRVHVTNLIMKRMYRFPILALLGAAAFAQSSTPPQEPLPAGRTPVEKPAGPPAPADVDQALRTRVNEFYTLLKTQQYRKAEGWVAEDTKDYYYAGVKPNIKAFELVGIEYSENFTHAKVTVKCTEPVMIAGFPPSDITLNIPTLWKIEDGKWSAYEDQKKINNPGGLQNKIESAISQVNAAASSAPPSSMPKEMPKDPAFALGKITVEKNEVKLPPGATEKIKIVNSANGPFSVELGYPLTGIEAKLDHSDLAQGDTAVLTLTAGPQPQGGFFYLRVMPTGEAFKIKVDVK